MLKNKQIYILISFFCASTLSLYSMEQALSTDWLQSHLNLQQNRLYEYQDAVETQKPSITFSILQRLIDGTQMRLNQNPTSYDLYSIRDSIDQISIDLDNALKLINLEKDKLQLEKQLSALRDRTEYLQEATPQHVAIPQNRVVDSFPSPQSKRSQKSKFSSTQPKRSSIPTQSQFNALKRFLTYFNGAAICTGIGLYSYYKLPEQLQWYRPVFIGLSAFGGTACSILAYKNLKFFISKYDTM